LSHKGIFHRFQTDVRFEFQTVQGVEGFATFSPMSPTIRVSYCEWNWSTSLQEL